MRRYASSPVRVVLLLVLLGALGAGSGIAQVVEPAPVADAARQQGLLTIILANMDFVFGIIILLSIIGVSLIVQGFIKTRASVFMPDAATRRIRELIEARRFRELLEFTESEPSFVSRALNPALKRAQSFETMKEAMETSVAEQTAESFRRIEYLNIIGNLGPLLGLLGTVLGMIKAFSAMQAAGGNADPTILAGGVSTALAHTFMGLFLAVPCLAAFGALRTMTDRLTIRGALVAEELLMLLQREAQAAQAQPPRPAARVEPAPVA